VALELEPLSGHHGPGSPIHFGQRFPTTALVL
jgi:hypothetical protein